MLCVNYMDISTKTNKQISNTLVCFICKYTLVQQRFQNICWWMVFHIIYHFIPLIMYENLEVIYRSMSHSIYQINKIRGTVILFWAIHKEKVLERKLEDTHKTEPEFLLSHHSNIIAQFTFRIHLYYTQSNICDDSICYMYNNTELLVCI
jgi:hypothetical protein